MTRFWTCSPVATRIGATPRAIAAWPRTSSGLVGSSIQYGSNGAQRAPSTRSPRRRPSAGWRRPRASGPGPISSRRIAARRTSSSTSAPTFILNRVQPSASASRAQPPDLVVVVAEPADRGRVGRVAVARAAPPSRAAPRRDRAPRAASSAALGRERVGEVAEVDERDELLRASCRASSCHTRLAGALRDEVPDRVDDGRGREVDDALLGPDPAQLAVADQRPPERAEVGARSPRRPGPTTSGRERLDGRDARPPSPRPIVNVRPWPSRPSPASVRRTT